MIELSYRHWIEVPIIHRMFDIKDGSVPVTDVKGTWPCTCKVPICGVKRLLFAMGNDADVAIYKQ